MYKTLNYRKKSAAASLAGLDLERPIRVRTIFCYIFFISVAGWGKKIPNLCDIQLHHKKIKDALGARPPAPKANRVLQLSNQGQKCLKKIRKRMTLKRTVNTETQHDESVIVFAAFFSPFP